VAYDIKYDCKTVVYCHGPAKCQLLHFWALKVSHDEVMLTLQRKRQRSDLFYGAQTMFQPVKLFITQSVMSSDGTHCYSNDNGRIVA